MSDNRKVILQATYSVDDNYDSERFLKLRVKVCHDGENRNGSVISKEALQAALPSIHNVPLLANVVMDENGNIDFGGHDMKIVEDAMNDGQYRLQYVEAPVGVFPADLADTCIVEEDGRNYLYASAFLWRGYANYAEDIIERRKQSDVSMEIMLDAYEYDEQDGWLHINKFTFTGVTLLGANQRPAMQDAHASMQFSAEAKDKLLAKLLCALEQDTLCPHYNRKDGDIDLPENTETKVNEIIDDPMVEDTTPIETPVVEETTVTEAPTTETFSATYLRKFDAVQNALRASIVRDADGVLISETYYRVMDMNDNYVLVERCVYDREGCVQDNGRFAYQYNKADDTAIITSEFEPMVCRWMTPEEAAKLDSVSGVFSELDELRAYKREKEITGIFAKFADLAENEQFQALVADNANYSIEELRRECYVIRGMANEPIEVPAEAPKLPVNNHNNSANTAPYGGVFEKFGFTKISNQEE